jgi:predicted RNA-binding Zn-ribbon protein involved in translation (DUF1610 family)
MGVSQMTTCTGCGAIASLSVEVCPFCGKRLIKRVMVGCPIGGQKQYSINLWFDYIGKQDYPNIEVCLCSNGQYKYELQQKLKRVEFRNCEGKLKTPIALILPSDKGLTISKALMYSRERIRQYAVEHGFDAIFWLDSDTIPLKNNIISELLKHDKEAVSGLYFYKDSHVPLALDYATGVNFTLDKLKEGYEEKKLLKCASVGYGCVLHQGRAIYEPFNPDNFGQHSESDDIGHCVALGKRGVEIWLDTSLICKHLRPKDQTLKEVFKNQINLNIETEN